MSHSSTPQEEKPPSRKVREVNPGALTQFPPPCPIDNELDAPNGLEEPERTKLDRVERVIWDGRKDPEIEDQLQDEKSEASQLAEASRHVYSHLYELVNRELLRRDMTDDERRHEEITERWRRQHADPTNN